MLSSKIGTRCDVAREYSCVRETSKQPGKNSNDRPVSRFGKDFTISGRNVIDIAAA